MKGKGVPTLNCVAERNLLVEEYREYAERLVRLLMRRMSLREDLYDDYRSAAYLGLIDAADRYDRTSPYSFQTYAFHRIRGAVIDSMRKSGGARGRRYFMLKALAANESLHESALSPYIDEHKLPSAKNSEENSRVAQEDRQLARILDYAASAVITHKLAKFGPTLAVGSHGHLEVNIANTADDAPSPEELLAEQSDFILLRRYIADLSEIERSVIEGFYFRDLTITEVAEEVVGASKSWVSRVHHRAIQRLKARYIADQRRANAPVLETVDSSRSKKARPPRQKSPLKRRGK